MNCWQSQMQNVVQKKSCLKYGKLKCWSIVCIVAKDVAKKVIICVLLVWDNGLNNIKLYFCYVRTANDHTTNLKILKCFKIWNFCSKWIRVKRRYFFLIFYFWALFTKKNIIANLPNKQRKKNFFACFYASLLYKAVNLTKEKKPWIVDL